MIEAFNVTKSKILENAKRWEMKNEMLVRELNFTPDFQRKAWKAITRYCDIVKRVEVVQEKMDVAVAKERDTTELFKERSTRIAEFVEAKNLMNCFLSDQEMERLINLNTVKQFLYDISQIKEDAEVFIEKNDDEMLIFLPIEYGAYRIDEDYIEPRSIKIRSFDDPYEYAIDF